jgi:anti-sigma regulatory factor (Ser/Thr protein kinase)
LRLFELVPLAGINPAGEVTAMSMPTPDGGYRHEAYFYADDREFVDGCAAFVEEGLAAGEPALVALAGRKLDLLRERLGEAEGVDYADMAKLGANPARIIPAWRTFVDERAASGGRVRGIGEPIYPERGPDELVECQRHEALLNLAFRPAESFWLLCPYSTEALPPSVLEHARRSHPFLAHDGEHRASDEYAVADWLTDPLREPPASAATLAFGRGPLESMRRFVAEQAAAAGLRRRRVVDAVVAVNEVANNSIEHGGGRGTLRIWTEQRRLVCEVSDAGRIDDPLVDRRIPDPDRPSGRGLWIANQLCELVQLRSFPTGTVVRLHVARA